MSALFVCTQPADLSAIAARGFTTLNAMDWRRRDLDALRGRTVRVLRHDTHAARGCAAVLNALSCNVQALIRDVDPATADLLAEPSTPMFAAPPDTSRRGHRRRSGPGRGCTCCGWRRCADRPLSPRPDCKPSPSCWQNRDRSGSSVGSCHAVRWGSATANPVPAKRSSSRTSPRPSPKAGPGSADVKAGPWCIWLARERCATGSRRTSGQRHRRHSQLFAPQQQHQPAQPQDDTEPLIGALHDIGDRWHWS